MPSFMLVRPVVLEELKCTHTDRIGLYAVIQISSFLAAPTRPGPAGKRQKKSSLAHDPSKPVELSLRKTNFFGAISRSGRPIVCF